MSLFGALLLICSNRYFNSLLITDFGSNQKINKNKKLASPGIEPGTLALSAPRSNQLSYEAIIVDEQKRKLNQIITIHLIFLDKSVSPLESDCYNQNIASLWTTNNQKEDFLDRLTITSSIFVYFVHCSFFSKGIDQIYW